ncbi:phosphonoacetaldehyde hydrolase [Bifidobacterium apri]|uniref:phosphonoacetaldehyde hydrolase n=1 Tax=Bifidobacterium apri TaxID=1769423 RepID=UPI0039931883
MTSVMAQAASTTPAAPMTPRFDAVIFDWAGTTVDYGSFAPVQAFIEAFREFGIEPSIEETRKPMGMLKHDHINSMLHMERIARAWEDQHGGVAPTDTDVDQVYSRFEPKLLSILDRFATPKPGVVAAVAHLRDAGIAIGSTTGYTDEMMAIVAPKAAELGYTPDCWFSADSVDGYGRPYPYMMFRNMQALHVQDVRRVVKVGDTIADIKEGKNAGAFTVGVSEGSSLMGLAQKQFEALDQAARDHALETTRQAFLDAGADAVIDTMEELPALLGL